MDCRLHIYNLFYRTLRTIPEQRNRRLFLFVESNKMLPTILCVFLWFMEYVKVQQDNLVIIIQLMNRPVPNV